MNYLSKTFLGALFLIIVSTFSFAAPQQAFTKARLYTGDIISVYHGNFPIVATVLENESNKVVKIIATYFVPETVSIFIPAKDIAVSDDYTKFNAVTPDPRGFDITWSAEINDGNITGVYFQPQDSGEIILDEVIDSSD